MDISHGGEGGDFWKESFFGASSAFIELLLESTCIIDTCAIRDGARVVCEAVDSIALAARVMKTGE